jgi:hypothetical protein
MRYYFDLQEGQQLIIDEEGREFSTIEDVQEEAARSLADMARDSALTRGGDGEARRLAIQVRDQDGPVLRVQFVFDVDHLKSST